MIRRLFVVAILLGVALVSLSVSASSSHYNPSGPGVIRLHSATINTAETSEYHRDRALAASHSDSRDDINQYQYIFHYTDNYDRSAIESILGFRLRRYLPDNAWHLFTTPKKIADIRAIKGVQWVGAYHSDYKYHMNIMGINPHKVSRRSINELFYDHFLSLNDTTNAKKMKSQSESFHAEEFHESIHDIHAVLPIYHENADYVDNVAQRLSATVKSIDASLHSRIELYSISGDTIVGHTNSEEDVQLLSKILSMDHEIFYVTRRPIFYLHNKWARGITQTNNNNPDYDAGVGAITFTRPLRGEKQIVGVADSGLDWQSCFFHDTNFPNGPTITAVTDANVNTITNSSVNLGHRKIVQYVAYVDGLDDNGHGTHVCGSIAGKASREISFSTANGMAYEAKLAFYDIGRGTAGSLKVPQHYELSLFPWARRAGAHIHSNSWGSRDPSYTQDASWVDDYMFKNPDFLILYAGGNDGYQDSSVGSPATAKNALTVGATANSLLGWRGIFCEGGFIPRPAICNLLSQQSSGILGAGKLNSEVAFNNEHVAGFSSNGPTKDGRNKPDIVAPGLFILSAKNGQSASTSCTASPGTLLNFQAGTSMATPITAGNVALIRQWFTEGYYPSGLARPVDAFDPSSALLKAMVLAGSRIMTGNVDSNAYLFSGSTVTLPIPIGPTPNKVQGYGKVAVDQTIYFAGDKNRALLLGSDKGTLPSFTQAGGTASYDFCIIDSATQLVRVALVWTDPPGTPTAATALVNDLDLVVTPAGGAAILGNQLSGATTGTVDRLNPQELVSLPSTLIANTQVNIKVSAFKLPQGPQSYALVVQGNVRRGACGSGGNSQPDTEIFQWQTTEWGKCSAMCKQTATSPAPLQTRTVSCISSAKGKVANSICQDPLSNAGQIVPLPIRECNNILCGQVEYEWTLGSWSGCTEPCTSATASGTQTRSVQCKALNVQWDTPQSEVRCSDHVKPPTQQKCNLNPCDGSSNGGSGLRWVIGNCTTGCSASCTCAATVKCYLGDTAISEALCTPANGAPKKPPAQSSCNGGQCKALLNDQYLWKASEWGPCSVGCNTGTGGGVQTRLVRCYSKLGYFDDEANCAGLEKPPTSSDCNKDLCPIISNKGASNLEWLIGGWGRCDTETNRQKRWVICANTDGFHDDAAKCEAHVGPQPTTSRSCTPIPFDSASWKERDDRQSYVWYLQDDRWSDPEKWCGNPNGKIYRYAWCVGLDGKIAETKDKCAGASKPAESRACFNCAQPCAATTSWYPGEYWMGCTTVDPCCGDEHRHIFCADPDGFRQSDTSSCMTTPPATTRTKCGACPSNAKCGDFPNGINGNTADGPPLPGSGVLNAPIMPPNGPDPTRTSSSVMMMTSPALMIILFIASFIRLF